MEGKERHGEERCPEVPWLLTFPLTWVVTCTQSREPDYDYVDCLTICMEACKYLRAFLIVLDVVEKIQTAKKEDLLSPEQQIPAAGSQLHSSQPSLPVWLDCSAFDAWKSRNLLVFTCASLYYESTIPRETWSARGESPERDRRRVMSPLAQQYSVFRGLARLARPCCYSVRR